MLTGTWHCGWCLANRPLPLPLADPILQQLLLAVMMIIVVSRLLMVVVVAVAAVLLAGQLELCWAMPGQQAAGPATAALMMTGLTVMVAVVVAARSRS